MLSEETVQYWPVFAFTFSLFIGSISVAIGASMWLAGKLSEQDARRIELKEAILLELRETRHTLYGRLDQQYVILEEKLNDKMGDVGKDIKDMGMRLTRLEATVENETRSRRSHPGS